METLVPLGQRLAPPLEIVRVKNFALSTNVMDDKKKAILLRIPPDLWEQLNLWAKDELRSLNAQIEYLLREAVRKRGGKPPEEPPELPQA